LGKYFETMDFLDFFWEDAACKEKAKNEEGTIEQKI